MQMMKPDALLGGLFHSYRLLEPISAGSQAQIYRARHEILGFECAIKTLPNKECSALQRERLLREARSLYVIRHPNVVSLLDCGLSLEGAPFLALELLAGPTLNDLVEREGPLQPNRARLLARQIAAGLCVVHRCGVIHRDLKPGNVIITTSGACEIPKIIDFGAAHVADRPGTDEPLTIANVVIGTPLFVAPEQIRSPAEVGPSADLYALGAILYTMLRGEPPFRGTVAEVLHQQLMVRPQPPATGDLGSLALALLEKAPSRRPASAEEVIKALDCADVTDGAETAIVRRRTAPQMPARSRGRSLKLGIGLALTAFSGGLMLARRSSPPTQTTTPTPIEITTNQEPPIVTPTAVHRASPLPPKLPRIKPGSPVRTRPEIRSDAARPPPPATPAAINQRMVALLARLRSSRSKLSTEEIEALQNAYFGLRERWRPMMTQAEASDLLQEVSRLERDLDRVVER